MSKSIGIALKEQGQLLAAEKAGSEWVEAAISKLGDYLKTGSSPFRLEEFKAWALADGLPEPASCNAWGAFPGIARRRGLIVFAGAFDVARAASAHGRAVRLWVAA